MKNPVYLGQNPVVPGKRNTDVLSEYLQNQLMPHARTYFETMQDDEEQEDAASYAGAFEPDAYIELYGSPDYLNRDVDDQPQIVIGYGNRQETTERHPASTLNRLLDSDTIYNKNPRSDDGKVPNSGINMAGALYQLLDENDPLDKLPDSSRDLAQLVQDLGRPCPATPGIAAIVDNNRDGTIESAFYHMPHKEPALQAEAEKYRRETESILFELE